MNEEMSVKERWIQTFILIVLFLSGLFDHSLWGANDTREGAMIWEMQAVHRWVTPSLNGVPYLEKPPLLHWTGVVLTQAFGSTQEGVLRLPAALFGFGAVWFLVLWGRKIGRERAGFAAAFMCATSLQYLEYSKIVLTDTCTAFMVMWSLWLFWQAYSHPQPRLWRWFAFTLVAALTFYAKGLIGPALVWVSVGLFLLWRREWKLCVLLPILFIICSGLVLLPWAWQLHTAGGSDFLNAVFWDNQFGRFFVFGSPEDNPGLPYDPYFVHKEGLSYYIRHLPITLLPWTLLALPAMVWWCRASKSPDTPFSVFMRFGVCGMWLLLHLSSAKAMNYVIPVLPMMFLMTAIWLEDATWDWDISGPLVKWVFRLTALVLLLIGLGLPVGYALLVFRPGIIVHLSPKWVGVDIIRDIGSSGVFATLLVGGCAFLLTLYSIWSGWVARRNGQAGLAVTRFPAYVAMLAILVFAMIIPAYDAQRTMEPFGHFLKQERDAGLDIWLAFSEEKHIGACIYYSQNQFPIVSFDSQLARKMREAEHPVGVVVKWEDLQKDGQDLGLNRFRALAVDYPGYASQKFRLLIWNPIVL